MYPVEIVPGAQLLCRPRVLADFLFGVLVQQLAPIEEEPEEVEEEGGRGEDENLG